MIKWCGLFDHFLPLAIDSNLYILEGCEGFTYKFKLDNKAEEKDYVYLI